MQLTIEWIIKMLSTDGINGKKIVRDRLKNATKDELRELSVDAYSKFKKMDLEEIKCKIR